MDSFENGLAELDDKNSKVDRVSAPTVPTSLVGQFMRRPISVCVLVLAMALSSVMAVVEMRRDILPELGIPVIYICQNYGGLDPSQVESYISYFYESVLIYMGGVDHYESRSISSFSLVKIQFKPGTDMATAMSQVTSLAERARASMPAGTVPPYIIRFDAGSTPVGDLVFRTTTRAISEVQALAANAVRPMFANVDGLSSPAPIGSGARSIVIEVDPKKMQQNDLATENITNALLKSNTIIPSGNLVFGDDYPLIPLNGVVTNPQELLDLPLRLGTTHATKIRDVGRIIDTADIPSGYALVNEHRTIYIPITKRPDASTLAVVDELKENLPKFQSVLPEDVKISFEFDQSGYVRTAIRTLFTESVMGAVLTGLMVLLFLRDIRSVFIVVLNIPLALMFSLLCLWIFGQTVNIMTLGGLALAVGVLVDETTVTIENIHAHLAAGARTARAALDATNEILKPALLSLLCVLSVFIPSFFMQGVTHALFVPLSMAVGCAMIGSFILSRTLVPVLSVWLLKPSAMDHGDHEKGLFAFVQRNYGSLIEAFLKFKKIIVLAYFAVTISVAVIAASRIGTEIFPQAEGNQMQMRLKAPTGKWIDYTEKEVLKVIAIVKAKVGAENVETSLAFVGTQPSNYPMNLAYLWTSGPQEAVLQLAFSESTGISMEALKEYLRSEIPKEIPDMHVSFEPADLVGRTMSQGADTPIEIGVSGNDIEDDGAYAKKILAALSSLPYLRDLEIKQRLHYPTVGVNVDRRQLAHQGLSVYDLGQALIPATSSSRYVSQNFWRDPKNGISYQVQVEVPQKMITSPQELSSLPIQASNGDARPLSSYATLENSTMVGEFDRYNMQRMISVIANLHGISLGKAAIDIDQKLKSIEKDQPRGTFVRKFGQMPALQQMIKGLGFGLILAVVVVFLLLAANYESIAISAVTLSTTPAVIMGALLMLLATKSTLNIQSFMGMIMAIGVSVSNSILIVTFAERARLKTRSALTGALDGAKTRLRPVLMTSGAMLAGMLPMALGITEGGEQMAPLGRAVLGGVLCSTLGTLIFLPLVFAWVQGKRSFASPSLDPDDVESKHFTQNHGGAAHPI